MKVVINKCFGGFGLSPKALLRLLELKDSHIKTSTREEYFGDPPRFNKTKKDQDRELGFLGMPLTPDGKIVSDEHRWSGDSARACPLLVQVVEELGAEASGQFAKLQIVEIPDGIEWEIDEYDGRESIGEKHRSWG